MRRDIITKLLESIPLETRIKVSIECAFITLITELGYRESKMWTDEEQPILDKLMKLAKEETDSILKEIEEWKKGQDINEYMELRKINEKDSWKYE